MSNTMRLVALSPLQTSKSLYFPCNRSCVSSRFISDLMSCSIKKSYVIDGRVRALTNFSEEGAIGGVDSPPSSSSPVSIELKPILNESQFDRVIAAAQQLGKPVVILWMATWCRKCIYLKPKLEKLAADYHPRVGFYCTDVNNVPHKLVARAGVTLWKDCKKQAEVIGGHKAYLVINEVREMIDNEDEL